MAEETTFLFFGENRSLFSDHYIKDRLTDHTEWKEGVDELFETTKNIYEDVKPRLGDYNEAQTEEHFIKPVLKEILGFAIDVQHSVKQRGRTQRPDYTFYPDEASLKKAQENREDDSQYFADALAVGDAKYWGRSLDGRGDPDKDPELSNANPSFQIVNYLTFTGQDWGILTNGRHWRLYYAKARSKIDSYFEIDLKKILEEGEADDFKYFYHFFRSRAFQPDAQTGRSFLRAVYEGSIDYGVQLENRLKDLIFDDIFLTLARGFVEYRKEERGITRETDESLSTIYQGTLRLLYRLLFLLHAESRGLLPVDEQKGYYPHSLMKLKWEVAGKMDSGETLSTASNNIWNDLAGLFRIIDRGAPR